MTATIMKEWKSGARCDLKYVKRRKGTYEELNTLVWEWFNKARSKELPVTGYFTTNLIVYVYILYVHMPTCLLKLAPGLVIHLAPSGEETPAM